MVVEAKPPIRRSSGVGSVLLIVGLLALCLPVVLIGAAVLFSFLFVRAETHYVAPAQPVVYSYSSSPDMYGGGMSASTNYGSDFEARMSAAQQIQDMTQRDEAFAVLAARLAGSSYEAGRALQQIHDMNRRDAGAWDAAKRFSEQNQAGEAVTLVSAMIDTKVRDAAFRAIATGQWPERPGSQEAKPEDPSDSTSEVDGTTTETETEVTTSS